MKRWAARANEPEFIGTHMARAELDSLMTIEVWDEASIKRLLDVCEKTRTHSPLYHRVKGGDYSVCGQLLGYMRMYF